MKKIIRITERDLTRIVKRTIREMSDDEDFNDIDKNERTKNLWDVDNYNRFVDDVKDEISFVIQNVKLAKDCEDLERSKTALEKLENMIMTYGNNELTDGEVEHYSEVIEFYYEMINSELEEC
jgi:CCR4-NOT transcriptional regulation complex NOT5 subunit